MPVFNTRTGDSAGLEAHVYNALDTLITHECFQALDESLSPSEKIIYNFERAMTAPAIEMMLRGIKVNLAARDKAVESLKEKHLHLLSVFDRFVEAVYPGKINVASPLQLKKLFYEILDLPEQYKIHKGERKVSTGKEALEKLEFYQKAAFFVMAIREIRLVARQISVLLSEVDRDGRMRTSYNVAGTETGRWSSSKNAWGGGTNLQNITEQLRFAFEADAGYKLGYFDLEQAESRAVGIIVYLLNGDASYLNACESGDLHTYVSQQSRSDIAWPNSPEEAKKLAENTVGYEHLSVRDVSKRLGHGTNYYGQPRNMSRHTKLPVEVVEAFQLRYFGAFPGIPKWHRAQSKKLTTIQEITTILGRTRTFFGRPDDDATLREAIAYEPQSMVGDILNLALWRVWNETKVNPQFRHVKILAQIHDAILVEYKETDEAFIVPAIRDLMQIPLQVADRQVTIPVDYKIGWNWGKKTTAADVAKRKAIVENPYGLGPFPDARRLGK